MDSNTSLAKRAFGSFFSSNIHDLVNMEDAKYRSPVYGVQYDSSNFIDCQLGTASLKKRLFYLTDEFVYLNHGAFGLTFKPVIE